MRLSGEQYMQACRERLDVSLRLIGVAEGTERGDRGPYLVASAYLSGVSVECMLRAFLAERKAPFDEKHDIRKMAHGSDFLAKAPRREWVAFHSDITAIWLRWRNSHRYYTDGALLAELRRSGFDRGLKGDGSSKLMVHARFLYEAASRVVIIGERQWRSGRSRPS